MPGESRKARARRETAGWFSKYFQGHGIDIGCGDDPVVEGCTQWDLPQGDAQLMEGLQPKSFDWVYSSHCLEHVRDPRVTLARWWELVKVGGYLIVAVPDWELYEQGFWPSRFNGDHKSRWSMNEATLPAQYSLHYELTHLLGAKLLHLSLEDAAFRYGYTENGQPVDQTSAPWAAEAQIEGIVQKLPLLGGLGAI